MINESGFKPYDVGVLIKVREPEEKKTKGGIILTSKATAPDVYASQIGVIVECGAMAFKGQNSAPSVGDEVYFCKYAGQMLEPIITKDERYYRIVEDHDVRLFVKEQNEEQ